MTQYSEELNAFLQTILPPQSLTNVLGEVVAAAGRTQLRTAETEKYPHVTYFLNGGREEPYPGEDRVMVPSPKVATYDLQPEMSAPELTDKAVEAIDSGRYDLIVLNYANPDMVGHTGDSRRRHQGGRDRRPRPRTHRGCDRGGRRCAAGHGRSRQLRADARSRRPAARIRRTPPIRCPLLLLGGGNVGLADGRLADLAPTLLALMDLPKPAEMTGVSLIR